MRLGAAMLLSSWAWGQFALLFWCAICAFAAGARVKGLPMTWRTWGEIAQAAGIVVILFALVSEGRGCARTTGDPDALCVGDTSC